MIKGEVAIPASSAASYRLGARGFVEGGVARTFPLPSSEQQDSAGRRDVDVEGTIPVFEVIEALAVRIGAGVRARLKQAAQPVDRLRRMMPEVFNPKWAAHFEYHDSLPSPGTTASEGNYVSKNQ